MSIRLSNKHGLNPSINVCFFCGKDKELILNGRLEGDAKAPHRVVANYTPCPECEEKMKLGVTVIEVTTRDTGALPIQRGAWPTGRWCVISHEDAARLFKGITNTKVLLEDVLYNKLVEGGNKNDERTNAVTR